jgi:catechol 2,3-dioxygenase-like lactoylglutathione lyase family enzyme
MATADMDATVRFWRDILGMRLVAGLGRPGYRQYFFEISDRDMIAFFEWPEVGPIPWKDHGVPVRGPFAFDHLSIGVEGEADLWTMKDRLEAADIWVSEVIDHGFIHSIYAFDPNRIPIEFSAAVPGVDLRKGPRMADRSPGPAAREGAEPRPERRPPVRRPTPPAERRTYPGDGRELIEDGNIHPTSDGSPGPTNEASRSESPENMDS